MNLPYEIRQLLWQLRGGNEAGLRRDWGNIRLYDSYAVDFNYATRQWEKLNKHSVEKAAEV